MVKSHLDTQFETGDALINHIRDEQLELFRRVGDLWQSQLEQAEDLAKTEQSVGREYRGRYLFELLQNANDAIAEGDERSSQLERKEGLRWNLACFELTDSSLLVANCGAPFAENNIRALCRIHNTTKSANKCVGHKGIGFKSVLEITQTPEVYSDKYAFGYDRQEFAARVRKIIGDDSITETQLSVFRAPFVRRLTKLPLKDRERIEALFESGYVTVIRLPLKFGDTYTQVEERMRSELRPELLLFLNKIDKLDVRYPSGKTFSYSRECVRDHGEWEKVILWAQETGRRQHIESMWLVLNPRELPITDPNLVEGLGEAWKEVSAVRCSAAFPLTFDGKLRTDLDSQEFRVYFPTEESCGLRYLVNADFYLEAARKDVRRNLLNDWLAEELALYIASTGVEALKEHSQCDPEIVDILAPVRQPDADFGAYFYEQYLSALNMSDFVPIDGGHYKLPSDIRFSPIGANAQEFRAFFPASYLRGHAKWAFSILEVEQRELHRKADGHTFLLRTELGAEFIALEDIVAVLRDRPFAPLSESGKFLRFLAHWWDELRSSERKQFIDALSECAVIPTHSGWKRPSDVLIFQANLRSEQDIEVPEGFDFELVPLSAYGEENAYQGVPARFLEAMGVSSYEIREILRRAILPKLRDSEAFHDLITDHPNSVYEAYKFLKSYFELERSITGFQEDLLRVPVPASNISNPSRMEWKPAGESYFSEYWTESDDLEVVYADFDDVYFLRDIESLGNLDSSESKREWYQFFAWLGVSSRPHLIQKRWVRIGENDGYKWAREHPFEGCLEWDKYLKKFEKDFYCQNTNPKSSWHGRSLQMQDNWCIDHFDLLAREANVNKLWHLFRLLGQYWETYQAHLTIRLSCSYVSTGCPKVEIPSYLGYCLQELPWIPAERGEQLMQAPVLGKDIWVLGDDVGPDVHAMFPDLPATFRTSDYKWIRSDLLKTEVGLADYLDLLQRLPVLYDLAPATIANDELGKWQKAVRAVFNWIGQALQNSLTRIGEENWPELPTGLPVLAYSGEAPQYIAVDEPRLAYPDDPFLAREWESDLLYLKVDQNWVSLRRWLRVSDLSKRVKVNLRPSSDVESLTQEFRACYWKTLPYFLAVVVEQQNSRFNIVLGRLQRLDLHVVEQLFMEQEVPDLEIPVKRIEKEAYLMSRDDPNPRGGQSVRAGDLYITVSARDNSYLLGDYIANYIEIDRLSDAFVLLYREASESEKLRYLRSHGIDSVKVDEVAKQLQMPADFPPDLTPHILHTVFQTQEMKSEKSSPTTKTIIETKLIVGGDVSELEHPTPEDILVLPPLNTQAPIPIKTYNPSGPVPDKLDKPAHDNGKPTRPYTPPSEAHLTKLGTRGEEWAYAAERQRLVALGLDPDALENEGRLLWVSQQNPGADHDIQSVDIVNGQIITIRVEVKATTGQDRTIHWPIREFRYALQMRERYWIYWVAHVDRGYPDPPIRFQDPVSLWQEGRIELDFRQLAIRLPDS